ncbi:hypothetical protein H8K90_10510 [Winogradskyella echinorum]|uniref:DUF4304 domain-containing protein n=1 Tax=Winogradskyella echinorum TaxID=538189 RepID=A0ABR6Y248_9FLAO|nr:hypothetical protein [Winogradskyella echinorum]MBC3846811.1 hypothetical protein [Winogradskyella echinorum]MBC5751159.1 hypothetical protein [Winogradskyella echinorum]
MPTPIHSKIINKIARKILKEHGIVRKGQSRKWLDDQYWFTTGIEFQPFKDRRGTCLNVGVNFHWYEQSYFSYDIGYRESEFIDFVNEEQFENEMNSLVELALKRTLELREKLTDIRTVTNTILNHEYTSDSLWGNYHRAIICGLNNEPKKSEHYFNLVLENKLECDWEQELKQRVEKLKTDLNNTVDFRNRIDKIIEKTRIKKKLKETEIKNVW